MRSLSKLLKEKGYVKIAIIMAKTNHFEITAKINTVRGRFILDTGASNTCIGMDKIDYFKLTPEASDIKAAGAGSAEMETLVSKKNKVQIGSWKKKKHKLVLFDLVHVNQALANHHVEPVDGIIGADILKKGKAIIDYDKRQLYLKV
ncbi:hypothetical protein MTsPCn5_14610 [Croceitalea sp. MTPC5]|uniref:retropepsin-like aspartic protease family protein n=1 Tax=Croceitalea sp. MTPC5 TaxID=3056565 RepID=UPI002B3876CB|nr:hypothetical protein MTsPCn5_14610 [Croceitalea sp. MTPC5]